VATNADDEAIARAYRGAGNAALAFDHALAAGIRARDHGEGRVALRALEEALAVADEAEVPTPRLVTALRALGDAYRPMGRPADALRMLDRAFALLPTSARGDRARTASRAVREASMANDLAAAELWLARAEDSLPEDDPVGVAAVANAGATFACYQGRLALARERFARAVSALEKAPESAENVTLRTTALLSSVAPAVSHSLELAQSLAEQARDLGEKTQNRYLLGVARSNLVHCLFTTGDMPKARAIAEDVLADAERAGNAFLMHLVSLNLAEVTHAMGDWDAARRHLTRARSLSEASGVWHEAAEGVSALCAWLEGDVRTAGKLATRALASAPVALAFQLIPLLLPAAAAAADRGDAGEAALIAERIDRHVEEPGRVDAAIEDAVRAYVLAAKDPLLGGRQLVSAIEGLEAVSFRAHMPMLLRDAAKLLARGGDRNAARACMRRAREALIARGCAAAVVRLDEIDLASGGAQERAGPRLSTVRSLDELARALRAVGRGAGFSEVRLFSLVDGVAKERGADGDPSLPTELEGAVRRVLAAGTPAQHGDLALHAVATDGLSACLAFSGSSRANALLLESAELGLATLAARASHKLDDSAPKTVRAKSSPEESRLLELTVGPLQIQGAFEGVVGKSRALMQALALLDRLADTDAPALLTGETGTGKEVFARALHAASQRAAGPFVTLNCAAIPATLFEAELFGYRKGAFTGAMRDQMGHARMADRGTLFLDEIGELPLELQPKLLRMVQERAVAPLGGGTEKKIDVRIVAATNRDLEQEVAKGRFRADLYYRLNVVEVHLPPLRERSGDVAELVRHLLARMDKRVEVTPRAMKRLVEYAWPGNVRELENELQRACVLASGRSIEERHLSPRLRSTKTAAKTTGKLADRVAAFERTAIEEVLEQCQGNRTRAAKVLGLTRQGLVLKLKKRGIGKSDNKRKGE